MFERVAPNGQVVQFEDGTSEQEVQKYLALPEFSPEPKSPTKEDQVEGIGGLAYDIGVRGGVGGARDAIQSSTNLAEDILENTGDDDSFFNSAVVFGKNNTANGKFVDFMSRAEMKKHNLGYLGFGKIGVDDAVALPEVEAPKTLAGDLTKGVSQFATGFYTGGKILKGVGLAKGLSKTGKFVELSVKSGVGDFIAFDENTGRLVDLIDEKAPALSNPIFEYLQTDENDTWAEGRMKNALEGFMLGGTLDVAMRGIRWAKNKYRKANGFKYNKETLKADQLYFDEIKQGQFKELKDIPKKEFADEFSKNLSKGLEDGIYNRFKFAQEFSSNKKSFEFNTRMLDLDLGFNARQFKQLDENGLLTIDAWNKATQKLIDERKIVLNDATVKRMATRLYKDNVGQLEIDARELDEIVKKAPARVVALNSYVQTLQNGMKHAGLQAADNREVQDFIIDVLIPKYRFVSETKKSIASSFGRTFRLINESGKTVIAKDIDNALKQFENYSDIKDPKVRAELVRRISLSGDADITNVLDYIISNKTINVANEIWINMLLSNPKTHLINMTSNLMNIFVRPLERMVGSTIGSSLLENTDKIAKLRQEFAPALGAYVKMRRHVMDSFKMAKSAFVNEEGIITSRNKLDVPEKAIQKTKIKDGQVVEDFDSLSGQAINTVGKVARISNRFLTAEDELFKQVVYRSELETDAIREAIQKNLSKTKVVATDIETGRQLTEFEALVVQRMQQGFDQYGKATNKRILRLAEEATFTQDLDGIFDDIQKTVNKFPVIKQILPFVRTPVNIMLNVTDRTGLGVLRKQWRDDFTGRNGARRMAQARGGLVTGYGLMLWASMLWKEGMITGSQGQIVGEKTTNSKNLKDLRKNTGVQPYSFRIYDEDKGTYKYINFGRLDPFGAFLGMVADYNTLFDQMTQQEVERVGGNLMIALAKQGGDASDALSGTTMAGIRASALFGAFTRNVFSKTYIKGLADFMEVITDDTTGSQKFTRYMKSKVGSYVPNAYTKFLNDEFVRDTKNIMEEVRKRAGVEEYELKYDFRGQPLKQQGSKLMNFVNGVFNPFTYTEQKDDPVADEILRLGENVPKLNDRLGGDIDLNLFVSKRGQTAYNRLQQHLRNVRFYGNKSLDQALRDLIASDDYKRLGDPTGVDEFNKDVGGKVRKIRAVINKYHREAEELLKSEANKFVSEKEELGNFTLGNSIDAVNRNMQKFRTGVQINQGDLEGLYQWSK